MKKILTIVIRVLALWNIVLGASEVCAGEFEKLKSSERAFNERSRHEVLGLMDLEEIFPAADLRALAKAAGKGDVREIDSLIARGVDVNGRGWKNATPLFWAFRKKSKKGFVRLLEHGADSTLLFDDGGGLMQSFALEKDLFYLKESLSHGGNPNAIISRSFEESLIFTAVILPGAPGECPALDLALEAGADVNAREKGGLTPVMLAASSSRFDRVFVLLQHGADETLRNDRGEDLRTILESKKKKMDQKSEWYSWLLRVQEYLDKNPTVKK